MMKKLIPYLIIGVALLAFYWYRYKRAPSLELHSIEVVDVNGDRHYLSDVMNGVNVVHFYATWCGPCMRELRTIKNNINQIDSNRISMICLTDDTPDQIALMRQQMPEQIRFYRVSSLKEIGIYTIPATYFINSKKEIAESRVEACQWEDITFLQHIKEITK